MNLTLSRGEELAPMSQSELFRQVHELSRNQRDHLLVLLQDHLDGGPYVGELREPPSEAANEVIEGWKGTIARRIDEMLDDRVEKIDAHGSALRLLNRTIEKYSP